jgi:lysophospholipase L1-like esterase
MDGIRGKSQWLGGIGVVAAIVAGAALPLILSATRPDSSLVLDRAPVAACSPPQSAGSGAPVADASPPCSPTLSATPHSGLRDGQTITVTGSGFAPNESVPIIECQTGATDQGQCSGEIFGFADADSTGAFTVELQVIRLIDVINSGAVVDCARRGGCVLSALDSQENTVVTSTSISFKKVPLPMISVTPSTGLDDGQTVTVSGSHFDAGGQVTFAECPAGANEFFECDFDVEQTATASASGTFSVPYPVARILTNTEGGPGGGSVDCAVQGCELAALSNFTEAVTASVPLAFDPTVPPLPPLNLTLKLKSSGTVQSDGGATVSGTMSCSTKTPVTVSIDVTVTEDSNAASTQSSLTTDQTCAKAPTAVTLSVPDEDVPFAAGVVEVTLSLSARNGSAVTQQTVSGAVTLTTPPHQPPPVYYVALGDSLAAGFASPPGQGYANDLENFLLATIPNLQLVDLGCSGETTISMIDGHTCSYPAGSQLTAATTFLAAHKGSVALITIDNGGNDYLSCLDSSPPSYNAACIAAVSQTVTTNLTSIMEQLQSAAGTSVPIVGMNYFDPFLDYWPDGAGGQAIAKESVTVIGIVNSTISSVYASFSAPVADVESAFQTTDLTPKVKSPWGRVPVAVVNTCTWLDFTCAKGTGGFGDDTNAAGSSVIAGAFEKVVPTSLTAEARKQHRSRPRRPLTTIAI